jgi:hypothetical protein
MVDVNYGAKGVMEQSVESPDKKLIEGRGTSENPCDLDLPFA